MSIINVKTCHWLQVSSSLNQAPEVPSLFSSGFKIYGCMSCYYCFLETYQWIVVLKNSFKNAYTYNQWLAISSAVKPCHFCWHTGNGLVSFQIIMLGIKSKILSWHTFIHCSSLWPQIKTWYTHEIDLVN